MDDDGIGRHWAPLSNRNTCTSSQQQRHKHITHNQYYWCRLTIHILCLSYRRVAIENGFWMAVCCVWLVAQTRRGDFMIMPSCMSMCWWWRFDATIPQTAFVIVEANSTWSIWRMEGVPSTCVYYDIEVQATMSNRMIISVNADNQMWDAMFFCVLLSISVHPTDCLCDLCTIFAYMAWVQAKNSCCWRHHHSLEQQRQQQFIASRLDMLLALYGEHTVSFRPSAHGLMVIWWCVSSNALETNKVAPAGEAWGGRLWWRLFGLGHGECHRLQTFADAVQRASSPAIDKQ